MVNSNLKRFTQPCLGPAHFLQSCGARTRRGTACQKPPLAGKTRCRLHGGLSTGPRTAEGKARIAGLRTGSTAGALEPSQRPVRRFGRTNAQ